MRYRIQIQGLSTIDSRCSHNLFLMCGNKKRSLCAKSQLYIEWPNNSMLWQDIPLFNPMWESLHCHDEEFFTYSPFLEFLLRLQADKWSCAILNLLSGISVTPLSPCDRWCQETDNNLLLWASSSNNFSFNGKCLWLSCNISCWQGHIYK